MSAATPYDGRVAALRAAHPCLGRVLDEVAALLGEFSHAVVLLECLESLGTQPAFLGSRP